ncbi:hypothetical protein HJD18_15850 [Thermoleophilia bacterium SCSIO 60948]|nr:hypothetical protein HJD18_15850 [Thermoleophilia bacterium SCSIO 60948]
MPATKIALICNTASGRGQGEGVSDRLRSHGAEVETFQIDETADAIRFGPDRLVVAGGDGSIAPSAQAAGRAGVPIAVVPVGTANDFARAHELPRKFEEACELAATGERSEPLEIGWMDDRPFVNVASIGLSPAAAREAVGMKKVLGPVAYGVGAIRAGVRGHPVSCELVCDGEEIFAGEAWQVTIACSGAFGGGSSVDADPSDGRLDAVAIPAGSRVRLARRAFGMRTGRIGLQQGVETTRCKHVHLDVAGWANFNVDGELVRSRSCEFRVRDDFFRLIVP